MSWDRPASVGYDIYLPSDAYGIVYYRVEVSGDPSDFQTLAGSVTCVTGQTGSVCHFDRRVALVTGLAAGRVYYYRVLGGTIIGDGQNSTVLTSPRIPDSLFAVTCPANTQCSGCLFLDECMCNAGYYGNATDTCTACAAGTYKQSSGFGTCATCPAGKTTQSSGSVSCTPCAAGTYKESSGSESCVMCPNNTLSLNTGSVSVSDCVCAVGYEWNASYPLRRLLEQDATYNCLAGEQSILLTDPVAHYVCRPTPPPPPPPPVEQCECSPAELAPPQMLSTPPITDAYEGYGHSLTVGAPPPRRLWMTPTANSYASYNYHVTRRLLQMDLTLLPKTCVPCESSFYKDSVSNARCQQCPADMSTQGGVNCTRTNNETNASAHTVGAVTLPSRTTASPIANVLEYTAATVTATPAPDSVSAPPPDLMLVVSVILGVAGSAVVILGSYLLWLKRGT